MVLHVDDTYIMVDCGMHVGFRDARRYGGTGLTSSVPVRSRHALQQRSCPPCLLALRFPDFKLLPFHERLTEMITAVVITHFHLDHCAALPYLTQASTTLATSLFPFLPLAALTQEVSRHLSVAQRWRVC